VLWEQAIWVSPEPLEKDEITCAMASGSIKNGSEGMGFKAGKLKSEGMGEVL